MSSFFVEILALVSTVSILIPTINVYANRNLVITRLGGNTRFETAIEISKEYIKQVKSPVTSSSRALGIGE
ncbi:cell wall-binding repeat-containing protein [Clostridium sp.]|uniref:cell wall-binding repeat-containing protein n=1 Tax=Clostridium sp. TaxID=1506 RepID=UPI001A3C7A5D|nr:cell wall-binding repeat-containing protein [Clostridium sp.]MBK5240321.1 cell wall-binding repeat-containing protein [Clostridium sp.]